jgi:hypothetical protein
MIFIWGSVVLDVYKVFCTAQCKLTYMENGLTLSEVIINLYITGLENNGSNCPFPA